jgi:GrpB-like predicted nucleotidyltransferase (UPF0157 family)
VPYIGRYAAPVADMPVEVVEYDPAGQHEFTEQRDRLNSLLHGWLSGAVEHVGSTAMEGLPADTRGDTRD